MHRESDLHFAARVGDSKTVARLLAAQPSSIHHTEEQRWTALHVAAANGHDVVAAQLLAVAPDLIDALSSDDRAAVHCAVMGGHDKVVAMLLALRPEHVHVTDRFGNTLLHLAARRLLCGRDLLTRLVNAETLRALNLFGETPFEVAMTSGHHIAVDVLEWQLSIDEMIPASRGPRDKERLRYVVELQCDALLTSLNRDVAGTVFEYLGFEQPRH